MKPDSTGDIRDDDNRGIDVQYIVAALCKRRRLIAGVITAAAALSVLTAFKMERKYTASSLILFRGGGEVTRALVSDFAASPDDTERLESISRMVYAWPMMESLAEKCGLTQDAGTPLEREKIISGLRGRIRVELASEVIQLSCTDTDPVLARDIVNALTRQLISENLRIHRESARKVAGFIENQMARYSKKLEVSERSFAAAEIEAGLEDARRRRSMLIDTLEGISPLLPQHVTSRQSPVLDRMNYQLAELEIEYARLKVHSREGNPKLIEVAENIRSVKASIDEMMQEETAHESVMARNPLYIETLQQIQEAELEVDRLMGRRREMGLFEGVQNAVPTQQELAGLRRRRQVDEDVYNVLLRQLESAYASEQLQKTEEGSPFTVLEYARVPLSPSGAGARAVVLLGLILGMAGSGGLAFLLEYLDGSFKTREDAEEILPAPVFGTVSRMSLKKKNGILKVLKKNKLFSRFEIISSSPLKPAEDKSLSPFLAYYHEPGSRIAGEFRVIRTNIVKGGGIAAGMNRRFMFTSAIMGEGKSIVSANFAAALSGAHRDKKILVLDCDLRRGNVKKIFGLEGEYGLSEVLEGSLPLGKAICQTKISNLYALPAGTPSIDPSELMGPDKMDRLFKAVEEKFDIAVIDSPPVLNLPEASIIGAHADTVVLVVGMGSTQKKLVLNAYETLRRNSVQVSGAVLNRMSYHMPRALYGYYYGEEYL